MNRAAHFCGLNRPALRRRILGVVLLSLIVMRLDAQRDAIERQPVQSTVLASAGYDSAKRLLEIEFRSGAIYRYLDVPEEIHRGLLAAESKGHFFGAHIRDKFRCERLKAPKAK
jgi:hypothetical protein